jgi:hypothetical protein
MKILQVLPMAVLLLLFGSCKKQETAMEEAPSASSAVAPEPARDSRDSVAENQAPDQAQGLAQDASKAAPATAPGQNRAPAVTRKLIRTVNLQLEVRDTEEVAARVQALATRLGGFVGSSNGQRREDLMYYSLTLRVPVERLDEAVAAIRALAIRVNQEHQQVDDVTDQYIDLDARMRTLEATETELRALLAESRQRARKVSEIMEVYQQLIEIRSQIEQIRTQLNSFDKLAALSTINLELMPTEAAKLVVDGDEWRPGDTLRGSARTLVGFLRWLLDAVIYFFVVLLPVGLVIAAVVLALRWLWRRGRRITIGGPPSAPPPGDGPAVQ